MDGSMDSSTPNSSESIPCERSQGQNNIDVSGTVQNSDSICATNQHFQQYLSCRMPPDNAHSSSVTNYCSEFHSTANFFSSPVAYSQGTHDIYYTTATMPPTSQWPSWYHIQPAYYVGVTQNAFIPFSQMTYQGGIEYFHTIDLQCSYSSPVVDSSSCKAMDFKIKCPKLHEQSESNQGHSLVGGKVASSKIFASLSPRMELIMSGADTRSSLMLRNIPSRYDQDKLLEELTEEGFGSDLIDFLYLPINTKNGRNRGYAFINFVDYKNIIHFFNRVSGRVWSLFNENRKKSCEVSYSVIQGKAAMLKNFENSLCFEQKEMYYPITFVSDGPNKGDIELIFT